MNKTQILKQVLIALLLFSPNLSSAKNLTKGMNSLGGNEALKAKARALDPDNKVRVVQNRTVDRTMRLEVGGNYGATGGGDPYLQTYTYGANLDLHVNPRFSFGGRYSEFRSELSSEGQRVFDDAQTRHDAGQPYVKPAVDFPVRSALATMSFYPIYGKMNMLDMGVTQFDLYVIGGYGQVWLDSGTSPSWTAGGGAGVWLNKYVSTRLEVRYQNYKDKIYSGERDMDMTVATFSIGIIL